MTFWLSVLQLAGIYVILTASYDVVVGQAGVLSMAHAAFFGVGAYAAALAMTKLHVTDIFVLIAIGAAAAAVINLPLALISLRVRRDFFIVGSLGFATIFIAIVLNVGVLGRSDGLGSIPFFTLPGLTIGTVGTLALTTWVVALIVVALVWSFERSSLGLSIAATRDNERGAEALGLRPTSLRVLATIVGAALAGVAGVLYVDFSQFITPEQFEFSTVALIVAMLGLGGIGRPLGYLIGPIILAGLPALLENFNVLSTSTFGPVNQMIYAAAMILTVRLFPGGLASLADLRFSRGSARRKPAHAPSPLPHAEVRARALRIAPTRPQSPATPPPIPTLNSALGGVAAAVEPALVCADIRKSFDEHAVHRGLSLTLRPGVVTGLLGPNGCGKSTLFDIICGFTRQDSGTITMGEIDLSRQPAWRRHRLGIARTFQDLRLFEGVTVRKNVELAVLGVEPERRRELVDAMLEEFGLERRAEVLPDELGFGEQKLLSLLRAYAANARVALLDEPASGLTRHEIPRGLEFARRIAAGGAAVCLVEHNMEVIAEFADEVVFIAEGRIMATGKPSEVLSDKRLADLYFGKAGARAAAA
ncbi:MAG TPA: ATP-binding cassette domain-containing protein [Solirubrobacteraceae bacterium]|jgi:branched-chain amino acid transport system permease protein